MTEPKIRMADQGPFVINHKLAGIVPMALPAEQAALTADIKANGQRDPIVLWHGEVVDGRCRQAALTMLGKHIIYQELDDTLTEDEVKIFVKSTNIRRNLSPTQKIMSAYKESTDKNSKSLVEIAKSWSIGDKTLKNARYIARTRPEFIEPLFNGQTVTIVGMNGQEVETNKVTSIYAYLKRLEEHVAEDVEHAWVEDSYIKTQAGKDWFYQQLADINSSGPTKVRHLLAELANYKFKKEIENNVNKE